MSANPFFSTTTMTLTYSIPDVAPYINWLYFDHAWGMSGKPETERQQLRREAEERLSRYADRYHSRAVFVLYDCRSEDEDIVLSTGGTENQTDGVARIPLLRQQQAGSEYLCLADFISPDSDKIGLFATTVDGAIVTDFEDDPYEKMMMQLVADRLAEATAERLHEQVRKTFWGYARDEQLTMAEMQQERFQGIRPAVGYPSLPDTSMNFVLDSLLGFAQIGIRLTESGAMRPHASVSGLMLAHPKARYFSIGKIGDDQLHDYARRRGVPVELMRKFLNSHL
jgi:cobalamin-dependent methionine synthase I